MYLLYSPASASPRYLIPTGFTWCVHILSPNNPIRGNSLTIIADSLPFVESDILAITITIRDSAMTKKKNEFNDSAQRVIVVFSIVAVFIGFANALSVNSAPGFSSIGYMLWAWMLVPVCLALAIIGYVLTIRSDESQRSRKKKDTPISKASWGYIIFYSIIVLSTFVFATISIL